MLGSVLTGPWMHQLILQPPTPVLQVWLPVFQVCRDTVECNLGSECCEKSCLPKSWEKPAEASPLLLGAMAQSCPCPQSSFGVGCRGVCAWLWTWLWLILMTSQLGLRPGTSLWAHRSPGCHQTCSALLARSLCLCTPLTEIPAVLAASPAHLCSSGFPSSSAAAALPSSWHGPQHLCVSETPRGDGQWYERHYCYDNKEDVSLALPSFSFLKSQSEIQIYWHEPGCRESSRQEELAGHVAGSFPGSHRRMFQGHRFRSAFLRLSCRQTTSSRRQRKLRGIATKQPQWFILNFF